MFVPQGLAAIGTARKDPNDEPPPPRSYEAIGAGIHDTLTGLWVRAAKACERIAELKNEDMESLLTLPEEIEALTLLNQHMADDVRQGRYAAACAALSGFHGMTRYMASLNAETVLLAVDSLIRRRTPPDGWTKELDVNLHHALFLLGDDLLTRRFYKCRDPERRAAMSLSSFQMIHGSKRLSACGAVRKLALGQ